MKASRRAGFTLVELVAVMTLSAILGLVVWRNLSLPIRAFVDGARRAELVATGRLAMMRMSREIRLALPNSVRVAGSNQALEFLRTSASGRYRAEANPADASTDPLNLNAANDTFQMLGAWTLPASVRTGAGLASCLAAGAGDRHLNHLWLRGCGSLLLAVLDAARSNGRLFVFRSVTDAHC
jgi:prepilin-type N-terminal cleavage/methylation domain-containing protein